MEIEKSRVIGATGRQVGSIYTAYIYSQTGVVSINLHISFCFGTVGVKKIKKNRIQNSTQCLTYCHFPTNKPATGMWMCVATGQLRGEWE